MNQVNGSSSAGILKRVMEHLHPGESKGLGEEPFPLPVGYKAVKVCSHSGQLATGLCSDVLLEYFKEGTEPVSRCGVHRRFLVDRRTGLQADRFTAAGEAELRTFWCLGPEYSAWASARGLEKPPVQRQRFPEARIEISNPVNRGRMVLDPETPRSFQTLALKARVEPRVSRIVWVIDGNVHKPVSYPYVFHWQLEPGEHTFQARFPNANVVSDVVSVTVSEY